jgi:hypothetical protein
VNPKYYGLVEMAFTGIIVLGFAFYQLWSVNRSIRKDRDATSEDRARHPVGQHLPDDR